MGFFEFGFTGDGMGLCGVGTEGDDGFEGGGGTASFGHIVFEDGGELDFGDADSYMPVRFDHGELGEAYGFFNLCDFVRVLCQAKLFDDGRGLAEAGADGFSEGAKLGEGDGIGFDAHGWRFLFACAGLFFVGAFCR